LRQYEFFKLFASQRLWKKNSIMKIGFIGLGIMGSRMVKNLASNGYKVFVYNRTAEKADQLANERIKAMSSPARVAEESDIVITMLSTPVVVQDMALGDNGFLSAMSKGNVWIDCSTVNPSFSEQMAALTEQLGFNFLDAPVAGSLVPAEMGELVFLMGGKKSIVKYCTPIFDAMGKKTIHVGEAGKGSSLKLVNNLVMGLSMYGFIEGLSLGESLGLEKEKIFDLMEGSPIAAPMVAMKRNKILNHDFEAEFPLQWLQKDLQLATQTAYEQGISLPGTNTIKEIFALASQNGLAEKDFTSIFSFLSNKKRT
jgi:3-hydroxyisobutyrate dehydrogenase/glyoxylate/succinic semialdehyde reductase